MYCSPTIWYMKSRDSILYVIGNYDIINETYTIFVKECNDLWEE